MKKFQNARFIEIRRNVGKITTTQTRVAIKHNLLANLCFVAIIGWFVVDRGGRLI